MLFSGFYANRNNLPVWIGWLEYLSPFKYSLEALMYNEHDGSHMVPSPITMLGFELGKWKCIYILIGLGIGYRILAFFFLSTLKKRLQ